jgi:hypothetical protein
VLTLDPAQFPPALAEQLEHMIMVLFDCGAMTDADYDAIR